MDPFLRFLKIAKQDFNNFKSYNVIHLVLGNESCDLDSIVSAISLAYLIHSRNSCSHSHYLVVPVINVEAKYFHLRTEVCYLLQKYGINSDILVFKDQIKYSDLKNTGKIKTSIVDHHVLSRHDKILENTVIEIFDHRTINISEFCHSEVLLKIIIKTVGSCSTLITEEIINSGLPILFEELCHLLYATIIYDTIGLDKECGKTFDDDIRMAQHLESILKISQSRKELFNLLWQVHTDTSGLTSKDLLKRDLKVVKGIPMPGLPMLVEDYLKRGDANAAVASLASEYNSSSVVIIGIDASKEVKRDIAVFSTDLHFKDTFIGILKNCQQSTGSDLLLTEVFTENNAIICFRQGNNKLTRKFLLPLVNKAVVQCSSTE